jgi:hypothetical protein
VELVELLLENRLDHSLAKRFASLPEKTKLPGPSICCFLRAKVEDKKAKRYAITPGGLYDWAVSDIFRWVKEHRELVGRHQRDEERGQTPGHAIQMSAAEQQPLLSEDPVKQVAELKQSLKAAAAAMGGKR